MKDKRITISKKQMRELGGMSGSALEEIYNFASEGDEEQAAGLAEAFSYVPMFISNSSVRKSVINYKSGKRIKSGASQSFLIGKPSSHSSWRRNLVKLS